MKHRICLSSLSLFACLGLGAVVGCDTSSTPDAVDPNAAALAACHDPSMGAGAALHACDPSDVKKTTICHIPPGNPANAHTICVGNAAVPAHLQNHGDSIGPCKVEMPCPPPPSGSGGATGTGAGGAPGGGSGGAAAADAGITIVP